MRNNTMKVLDSSIHIIQTGGESYICLTDMLQAKDWDFFISDWLRNRNTVEFLSIWEEINNPDFNYGESAIIKSKAGLNGYKLSIKEWTEKTHAIGIISKAWRYGGTYAHPDIAFEFGMWISPEFKLYLIKEFQRLKNEEQEKRLLGWDIKRELTKVNYKIHTDAIKEYLLPTLTDMQKRFIYADEADFLNILIFGKTAKIWQEENHDLKWNIRDHANARDLIILSNIESLNAHYISEWLSQEDRYLKLRDIIIKQRLSLESVSLKQLGN